MFFLYKVNVNVLVDITANYTKKNIKRYDINEIIDIIDNNINKTAKNNT